MKWSFVLKLLFLSFCASNVFVFATPVVKDATQNSVALPTPTTEEKKSENIPFFKVISEENLKSLLSVKDEQDNNGNLSALINSEKEFWEVMQETLKDQLNPKAIDKRTQIFTLLTDFEKKHPFVKNTVLDQKSIVDLELLSGPKSDMSKYLAASLDRNVTEAGRAMFFYKLVTPTSDISVILQQQAVIKELVANEALFKALDDKCKSLAVPEAAFLSFWKEDMFKGLMRNHDTPIPFFKSFETWLNNQPMFMEAIDKLDLVMTTYGMMMMGKMGLQMGKLIYQKYANGALDEDGENYLNRCLPNLEDPYAWFSLIGLGYLAIKHFAPGNRAANSTAEVGYTAFKLYNFSRIKGFYDYTLTLRKCLHEKLILVAAYINGAQELIKCSLANEVLRQNVPHIKMIDVELEKKSTEVKDLLALLQSSTFKGESSALNQYTGRLFVAYKQLHKLKDELADVMVAVGEIDAQLSIVRLYKEFEGKSVTFCFPTFVTSQQGPAVKAEGFWNPVLSPEKVITNSLTLGSLFNQKRNAVVTGPNAGGKSTIMKGFVINLICAQSLGICPAVSFECTPFTSIMTYLNITDDIAAGNSHFKAGVVRARELIEASQKLQSGEYGFFAADEVFNGTTHNEGQAAAFSLLKKLGCNERCMVVTPSHFPLVAGLEAQTECFSNYKVSVEYNEHGNITYPYKLLPGRAHQNVAFKILEEEGFGDEFLAEATRCLAH